MIRRLTLLGLALCCAGIGRPASAQDEKNETKETPSEQRESPREEPSSQKPQRKVRRAPRPAMDASATDNPFFDDVFTDALAGERPAIDATGNATSPSSLAGAGESAVGGDGDDGAAWSNLVSAAILEDEIKRQQIRLNALITNPGQFKTRNSEIRESFQILAMCFAVVSQYDGTVRWQDEAVAATRVMNAAARQARGTDMAAFQMAKDSATRLADLIRGGNFGDEPGAEAVSDWTDVIDRSAVMDRLEHLVSEPLKTNLAAEDSFAEAPEDVLHDAAMVAVLGRVLQLPYMTDADDEDYSAFATEMIEAAQSVTTATIANDFDRAAAGLNQINQSCIRCHAEWR